MLLFRFSLGSISSLHAAACFLFFAFCATAQSASYTDIGLLPGGGFLSRAWSITPDGSVAVGNGDGFNGFEAYYWTESGGIVPIGDLAGGPFFSYAADVSNDGSIIVGTSRSANGYEAYYWTQGGGMVALGDLPGGGFASSSTAISGDGTIIAGYGSSASGVEATRWTQGTGLVGLGDLAGGTFFSVALAISEDGSVIAGQSDSVNGPEAVRWTQGTGLVGLGDLTGGIFESQANAVSQDSQTIVGYGSSANGHEAFRWTQSDGMVALGGLTGGGGFYSEARAVNVDGSVIVGHSLSANGYEAFRWTESGGVESIMTILQNAGVDLTNIQLMYANGVSADGTIVVGEADIAQGSYSSAYIANLATMGVTTPQDLSASLRNVSAAASQTVGLSTSHLAQTMAQADALIPLSAPSTINGNSQDVFALVTNAGPSPSPWGFYATGGYGFGQNNDFSNGGWNGTLGLTYQWSPDLMMGAGLIGGGTDVELDFGGRSNLDSLGSSAVFSYAPLSSGLRLYGSFFAADLDLQFRRNYRNGAAIDASEGEANGFAWGAATKLGWAFPVTDQVSVMPFTEYRWSDTVIDRFTETGGGFPASYSEQNVQNSSVRFGIQQSYRLTQSTNLGARVAYARRLTSDDGNAVTASASGFTQTLGVNMGDRNWAEAGAGMNWQVAPRTAFNADLSGRSGDTAEPAAQLLVGVNIRF